MGDSIRAMFIDVSGKGGITHYIAMMCRALTQKNIEVSLLTTRTCELDLKTAPFRHEHRLFAHHSRKSDMAKGLIYLVSLCLIVSYVRKTKPCVLHWHELKIHFLEYGIIKWLRKTGVRTVCSVHDVIHQDRPGITPFLNKLYHEFDALVAHTDDTKTVLRKQFDIPIDRIHVIPIGEFSEVVTDKALTKIEARKMLKIGVEDRVLLFFGYIRRYKGLDLLLKSMPDVLKKYPRAVLIIAGETKEDFKIYERLISDLHISHAIVKQIQYIPLEHMPRYFYASDAVVMPYRSIYQSGIVHLAFAFKRPVIATRVGGLPEVVQDGKNGFLVAKDDVQALSSTIVKALANIPALEKMGEYAFFESKKRLSWDTIAGQVADLYRVLCGENDVP